eukprot:m.15213 g.15213  ORF g.15213 m.15213 type:complete len:299 (-) comp3241_c0_seq1:788-1684(-)
MALSNTVVDIDTLATALRDAVDRKTLRSTMQTSCDRDSVAYGSGPMVGVDDVLTWLAEHYTGETAGTSAAVETVDTASVQHAPSSGTHKRRWWLRQPARVGPADAAPLSSQRLRTHDSAGAGGQDQARRLVLRLMLAGHVAPVHVDETLHRGWWGQRHLRRRVSNVSGNVAPSVLAWASVTHLCVLDPPPPLTATPDDDAAANAVNAIRRTDSPDQRTRYRDGLTRFDDPAVVVAVRREQRQRDLKASAAHKQAKRASIRPVTPPAEQRVQHQGDQGQPMNVVQPSVKRVVRKTIVSI